MPHLDRYHACDMSGSVKLSTYRPTDVQTDRPTDRLTCKDRQHDRQTDRQQPKNRQNDRVYSKVYIFCSSCQVQGWRVVGGDGVGAGSKAALMDSKYFYTDLSHVP